MRLVKCSFALFLLLQSCSVKIDQSIQTDVILKYIESNFTQERDPRLYNPPPPPELWDSLGRGGNKKPDSLISHLKPLKVFINKIIEYDSIFNPLPNPRSGFEFLDRFTRARALKIDLDLSHIPKQKGVVLASITKEHFYELYKSIRFEDDYGGFISFNNLYYSSDRKKAYFEVTFFKGRLNSSTNAVYADLVDGKWRFKLINISIS